MVFHARSTNSNVGCALNAMQQSFCRTSTPETTSALMLRTPVTENPDAAIPVSDLPLSDASWLRAFLSADTPAKWRVPTQYPKDGSFHIAISELAGFSGQNLFRRETLTQFRLGDFLKVKSAARRGCGRDGFERRNRRRIRTDDSGDIAVHARGHY